MNLVVRVCVFRVFKPILHGLRFQKLCRSMRFIDGRRKSGNSRDVVEPNIV